MDGRERKRILASIEGMGKASDIDFEITDEISEDIEIMTALINVSTDFWLYGNPEVKRNKQLCMIAVEKDPFLIHGLEGDLLNDMDIAKAALRSTKLAIEEIFKYMGENVKKQISCNSEILINELEKASGYVTRYANEELKNNRDFAKVAVKYDRDALWHLDERFRDDIEIVIEAIKCKPGNFLLVSPTLQKNKALAIFALRRGGKIFPYLDEKLRGDRDVVKAAIEENGIVIEYASEELKNDPKLREKAKQTLLRQIEELPHDKSFHTDIINYNCPEEITPRTESGIADIAMNWIKDKKFMKEAVARNAFLLGEFYPNNLCEKRHPKFWGIQIKGIQEWEFDEDVALVAVASRKSMIDCLSPHIREKRDVLIQGAKSGNAVWEYLTEEQKKDKEFMVELLKANPSKRTFERISKLFPEDTGIEKIYKQALSDYCNRKKNKGRISEFERKVKDLREQRRERIHKKSVSIIVRDEVTKQERKVDILLAVLLDKKAQLMGYNNYGEQRKCEANNELSPYMPTEKEQLEIQQITKQIERMKEQSHNKEDK